MDNCNVKFSELTRTVATKNVTISALFNIHNAQTSWLCGLSGRYTFADENGLVPQLESFAYMNWTWVELARSETQYERRSDQSLALAFLELFFYLSLQSCCSWLVCKLSAWTLCQSFLHWRILYCVCDLTNSTSWGTNPFSSAKMYVPERPRSQHVWALWCWKVPQEHWW